jgi:tetratricopeptide (TPR) repeat protein
MRRSKIPRLFKYASLIWGFLWVAAPAGGIDIAGLFRRGDQAEKIQVLLDAGRSLVERRLYDQGLGKFYEVLEIDALHEEATWEIAETYFKARAWSQAVDWFYVVATLTPQNRKAFSRRWRATVNLAQGDTVLQSAARQAVRDGIGDFLETYAWNWETLKAAREGALAIEDSILVKELTNRILERYPDTPIGYEVISEIFYEGLYPIWNDPAGRISYIREFLQAHPVSQFRETVWLYLTYALNETEQVAELREALTQWMAEDSQNPLPLEKSVRYLIDKGLPPDSLLPAARRAVELSHGWRGQSLKHVEQRIMEGKNLYAATRLNIARVLMQLDRLMEARLWLEDGCRHSGFGPDDEGTTAALNYHLGLIAQMEGRYAQAFDYFVEALIEGDTRPEWIVRADSAAKSLFSSEFADSAADYLTWARQRRGYDGPVYADATDSLGLKGCTASRVAWGDANGDGWDDLLLGGWRLFLNSRGERFFEITDSCGLRGEGVTGGVWADADVDGDLDLFCAANGKGAEADRLYLNLGSDERGWPHFREAGELSDVVADSFPTEGAAWGDLQGDGRPDLYVANYELSGPELAQATPDFLYLNLPGPGDSSVNFQRLGPDRGLTLPFGENFCGRGANWGDFDGDGDQDIYVSNYRLQENLLWENNSGRSVENRASFYGIAGKENDGWWGHTIGSEWADFDNDGDLDLITANLAHPRYIEISNRTCLYENRLRQEGLFAEVRAKWGIKYQETHSDPAWGDVDNDGDLDLYLTCIYPNRPSFLYQNDLSERRFIDISFLAGIRVSNAWGCAFSDFDRDGDLDLAVGSSEGVRLFRSEGNQNHWLELDVQTPGSGYGTRVLLRQGDQQQLREIQGGKGTTSQHSRVVHFGLGRETEAVSLEVRLPSGRKVKLKKISRDQRLTMVQP